MLCGGGTLSLVEERMTPSSPRSAQQPGGSEGHPAESAQRAADPTQAGQVMLAGCPTALLPAASRPKPYTGSATPPACLLIRCAHARASPCLDTMFPWASKGWGVCPCSSATKGPVRASCVGVALWVAAQATSRPLALCAQAACSAAGSSAEPWLTLEWKHLLLEGKLEEERLQSATFALVSLSARRLESAAGAAVDEV